MALRRSKLADLLERLWYSQSPFVRLLWPVGFVTGLIASLRRRLYSLGVFRSFDSGAKVIVVGNITVGGTGKTPLTIWLARKLRERGFSVGIVCSGYGGQAAASPQLVAPDADPAFAGDEAVLLAQQTDCPVAAGRDRVTAAGQLLGLGPLDIILSDDGMQHYRLRRDVEVAVVDGTRALGNGMCLPAGPLREPARRLAAVDAVVVNDGDFSRAGALRFDTVLLLARNLSSGREAQIGEFRGKPCHAVAAIGNPERFFAALEREGLQVKRHPLPDHAVIDAASIEFDDELPVLLTEKDAVKCRGFAAANVWAVAAGIRFRAGEDERFLERITHGAGLRIA